MIGKSGLTPLTIAQIGSDSDKFDLRCAIENLVRDGTVVKRNGVFHLTGKKPTITRLDKQIAVLTEVMVIVSQRRKDIIKQIIKELKK